MGTRGESKTGFRPAINIPGTLAESSAPFVLQEKNGASVLGEGLYFFDYVGVD